ncbi:MAG TPA: signal peptidase I [Coprothermobacter sp.]|nr:signal peptidase I [Coprothermobacter sp.]
MSKKVVSELFQWLVALVLAAAIVIPIRVYVLQPYRVYMTSMVPTLQPGDVVIGLKSAIVGDDIKRGDIVIVGGAFSNGELYVKRVIGLPGETISINDGEVYINGQKLEEPWLPSDGGFSSSGELSEIKLGENQYFVLGDNRFASRDSRSFGPVTKQEIKAKVVLRIFPLDRIRSF